jgi:hypothetical protein
MDEGVWSPASLYKYSFGPLTEFDPCVTQIGTNSQLWEILGQEFMKPVLVLVGEFILAARLARVMMLSRGVTLDMTDRR